ncbi:hypothetical protein [Fimbriiglobus ruber]|uniref:hypothetical protein n=1 Tax=Fimbriiglobus ruber TaxID=1908690 RepID=UPI00117A0386|nr:hypothetical protein [Fimbriiglobus ruber]
MNQPSMTPVSVFFLLFALVSGLTAPLPAKEAPEEKKDKARKDPSVDDEWHKEAEKIVNAIEMEKWVDENWAKVKRIEKPLLYYSEPTRNHDRGSVWAWGDVGRPVALAVQRVFYVTRLCRCFL